MTREPTDHSDLGGGNRPIRSGASIRIRQAFYEGLSRYCLKSAWASLDRFRQQKPTRRLIRQEIRDVVGMTLEEIANALQRNPGTLSRWFSGESPDWANLLVMMTQLRAQWKDLGELPSFRVRREAALRRALWHTRKAEMDDVTAAEPTAIDMLWVEKLFAREDWVVARVTEKARAATLDTISHQYGVDPSLLDQVDRRWGNAWLHCFDAMHYMDWQDDDEL